MNTTHLEETNYGEMGHALTVRMTSVIKELKDKYEALYNTNDFESKIRYLDYCDLDELASVRMELVRMFSKCGIEGVDYGETSSYYRSILKKSNIMTPKEMTKYIYNCFLKEFTENPYPLPDEYIERIVNDKIDPSWGNDTLRLKILKKFLRDADGLRAAKYNKCHYVRTYVSRKTGKASLGLNDIINNLDDGVFDEMAKNLVLSEETINLCGKCEEIRQCINDRKKVLRKTKEYKNLSKDERKKFLLSDDVITKLNRELAPLLKVINKELENKKEKTKKKGKYALLKIADDLANGRFRTANVAREEIYLFAIVFELTFYTGDSEEIITEEGMSNSIEKVMFEDYYSNNIMRYISDGHDFIKRGGEEQDPTGRGINFKNYMEVIFLYYLRRWDLSIVEKLERIYRMAELVHTEYVENEKITYSNTKDKVNKTQYYGDKFKENIMETEEQFKEFLLNYYDCSFPPETTAVFSVELEQQTAINEYRLLLEDLEDYCAKDENWKDRTMVYFKDEVDIEKVAKLCVSTSYKEINYKELDAKTKFDMLLYEVSRDLEKRKSLNELERGIVSRTDILRLVYKMYIYMNEDYGDESLRSFSEVYNDFSELANQHLSNALLRPISGRDLYDLIVIFFAYCNINDESFLVEETK